jgi:hypothetical protein
MRAFGRPVRRGGRGLGLGLGLGAMVAPISCSALINSDALSDGGPRGAAGVAGAAGAFGAGGAMGAASGAGASGEGSRAGAGGADPVVAPTCRSDQKVCPRAGALECFWLTDPTVGCADSACDPCGLPHATATCGAQGTCRIDRCVDSFSDCDGNDANGCEANLLTSNEHCGNCYQPCASACSDGICD